MDKFKYVVKSAVIGAVITLATGLVPSTPGGLVGASWYGLPLTWIRKLVLAPQYNPWVIDWYGLLVDFIFWFVISWLALYLISRFMKPGSKPAASKSAKGKNK